MTAYLRSLFDPSGADPFRKGLAYLFLFGQLALASLLLHWYEVEPTLQLFELSVVVFGGFAFQLLIPPAYRHHFFLLLGLLALFLIMGAPTAWIVLAGGMTVNLIALYTRPAWLRYSLLLLFFGILAGLIIIQHPWSHQYFSAFSILGSMYLFRLIILLYDRSHGTEPVRLARDSAYFFLAPNMSVMLFPAVDYKLFIREQLQEKQLLVHKKGVQWIVLGLFHLIVYRLLYYYLLVPMNDVLDLQDFLRHATTNYALVLRLSGIFHTVVGMLCLFGYDLPPTFNNYFLASGFSDLWRRLNIYFRDFMVKVFYYPLFFRFRRWGTTTAILITILILFNISWFIHSLQWFWLKGNFPIKDVDMIYWNLFGVLVAGTALWEMKRRKGPAGVFSVRSALAGTAGILATFLGMSFLWSLWSAPSLSDWLLIIRRAMHSPTGQYAGVLALLGGVWVLGSVIHYLLVRNRWGTWINPAPATARASFWSLAMLAGLLLLRSPIMVDSLENRLGFSMEGLLSAKLTAADEQQQVEGYYTDILFGTNLTSPLAEMATARAHQFRNTQGAMQIFDYRGVVMRPNTQFEFRDKRFRSNRWGGRDKDYDLLPPPNTVRVLLTGGSFLTGSGVHDEEVFDGLLEDKMNALGDGWNYEFMNFSCPSYDLVDVVIQFKEDDLAKFKPDYLFFISQGKDLNKNGRDLVSAYRQNIPMPMPYLEDIVRRSGLKPTMTEQEMLEAIEPFEKELLEKSYATLYEQCRQAGIIPVWAYWPTVNMRPHFLLEKDKVKALAEAAGFAVIDLTGVYDGLDPQSLRVSADDNHPNAEGHRLVAEALYQWFTSTRFLHRD
jgi:hypothetical protein